MKFFSLLKGTAGFTLIQAIFILVVLGLLGGVMMRLAGVQSSTSLFALQGARAYQAARSGVEWGAARAENGASCNGTLSVEGFTVVVSCLSDSFVEGGTTTRVYRMTARAALGAYGSPDYISRTVELKAAL